MAPTGTPPVAITPQGVRDGDPEVLAALVSRRGPAVVAFATELCEPAYVTRAAADAFARFRAAVADPGASLDVHPDALLLRCARRAALDLAPRGPDLGCGPALALLAARAERTIKPADATLLARHLETCEHCQDLAERLEAADRAYREAADAELAPDQLAPMVAALAAAAPVRPGPARPAPPAATNGAVAVAEDPDPDPVDEPEPADKPEPAEEREGEREEPGEEDELEGEVPPEEPGAPHEDEAESEADDLDEDESEADDLDEDEPEDEDEDEDEDDLEDEDEPEDEDDLEDEDEPLDDDLDPEPAALAPAEPRPVRMSYYELPPLPPRERGRTTKRVAKGAVAAGGAAASLTRRAGAAARRRMDRPPAAEPPGPPARTAPEPAPAPRPVPEPAPAADTATWQRVDEIEFPERERLSTPLPDAELEESSARAAARHYRRLRHSQQREEQQVPPATSGHPPRLPRPVRERQYLPLRAHGARDLLVPAGLVVIAALVIMAVAGVFGGGSSTPPAGTQANAAPVIAPAAQSVTAISTADAVRLTAGRSRSTTTATTP